ncbi:uncharacterized protein V6R79_006037 [Siganus canaliculatus]
MGWTGGDSGNESVHHPGTPLLPSSMSRNCCNDICCCSRHFNKKKKLLRDRRYSNTGYLRVKKEKRSVPKPGSTPEEGEVPFCQEWCHRTNPEMRIVRVCFCLALLLPCCVQSQRSSPALAKLLDEDTQRDVLAVDILNRSGVLNSLLRSSEHHAMLRRTRAPRPVSQVPKRAQQGSRFALSLDVPTSILSVLIDLAKNQDMRTKAAANAELMARIGKRK